jgi:fucose 4-O-acetylase-like acetyltransferase
MVIVAGVFVYGVYYWTYMDIKNFPHAFWNVDQACFYLYFLSAGYFFSKRDLLTKFFSSKRKMVLTMAVMGIAFSLSFMARERVQSEVLVLLAQTVMCNASLAAFIAFSKCISRNRILDFLGQNTLTILALHMIVQSLLKGLLAFVFHIPSDYIDHSFLMAFALTVVALVLLVPEILFINRFVPWVAGKRPA